MDLELNGKVALVTAVTSGVGLATARGRGREGAHVRLNGRPQPRLDAAAASIQDLIPGAVLDTVVGDVSTVEGVAAIAEAVADVGAGGTDPLSSFVDLTDADWQFLWTTT
ncbi:MAG TPA: SDR family NAD(P)-dependent oxidoreductase [Ilumatobacter sp.]